MKRKIFCIILTLIFVLTGLLGCLENNYEHAQKNGFLEKYDEFCFSPFCDPIPKIYNFSGLMQNPSDFLGNRIKDEAYSNWEDYMPLVNKVNEIVFNKSNDYEKFIAIASYVKNSKEYGFPSPANSHKTVIDIFESPTGVCVDASILATAMLRIAGIPTQTVQSGIKHHNFNKVYINNTWMIFDANFGEGEPIIIDYLHPKYHPNFIFQYVTANDYAKDYSGRLLTDAYFYKIVYNSSEMLKSECGEGRIVFPVVSAWTIYHNFTIEENIQNLDVIGLSNKKQDEYLYGTWFVNSDFEVVDDFNKTENGYEYILAPNFYHWGAYEDGSIGMNSYAKNAGYYEMPLPAFKYRLNYSIWNTDYNVAYVEFQIKDGETKFIQLEDIKKTQNASQNNFNVFMNLIRDLPSYESLI